MRLSQILEYSSDPDAVPIQLTNHRLPKRNQSLIQPEQDSYRQLLKMASSAEALGELEYDLLIDATDSNSNPSHGIVARTEDYIIEIIVEMISNQSLYRIAVRDINDDDMSWEFMRHATLDDVKMILQDPNHMF